MGSLVGSGFALFFAAKAGREMKRVRKTNSIAVSFFNQITSVLVSWQYGLNDYTETGMEKAGTTGLPVS